MKRLVIFAVAGIALLLAGAVALITFLGDGGPSAGDAPPALAPVAGGDPQQRPAPGLPPGAIPVGAAPFGPPIEYGPAPAKPPPGSWEAVAPVARPGALGPLGGAITQGLAALKPDLDECYTAESQARNAEQYVSEVKDEIVAEDNGTATLMLQLEGSQGSIRIVDAPVEMRGTASDGLIACVQKQLRGHVIPAAAARPGTRYRIPFPLSL